MPPVLKLLKSLDVSFARKPEGSQAVAGERKLADNGTAPYKFAYSRTALRFGLTAAGLKKGDSILAPEFICDSALEPAAAIGINPVFYRLDPELNPDWTHAETLLKPEVKALLLVHYFGQPADLNACSEFCRKHSILLIEDNAHGYGACFNGKPLGTFGSIGFTSPRKSFPIANGAYLYLKDIAPPDLSSLVLKPGRHTTDHKSGTSGVRNLAPVRSAAACYRILRTAAGRLGPPPAYDSQTAFRTPSADGNYGMDSVNDRYIKTRDLDSVRAVRRKIYETWKDWAEEEGLRPVFSRLHQEAMPLVFPAFTDSFDKSKELYLRGHRKGIDIHSWPTLPESVVEKNGEAVRLWENLVCFPIHQMMDTELLSRRLTSL